MGDRALFFNVGKEGLINVVTYTYTSMKGEGGNKPKDFKHNDRHLKWFFVY